jgi:outer membrane protein assembly factor BamD (BamD/ComL family)
MHGEKLMKKHVLVAALVLVVFAGCSKPTPGELYGLGQEALTRANSIADTLRDREKVGTLYDPAIINFKKLADAYPQDPLAGEALYQIASIQTNVLRRPDLAVETFKRFLQGFPANEHAPMAQFLVGYIYNNELHNSDSAAAAYRIFLEHYPQHDLAASARFELDNLGKAPEELLPPPPPQRPQTASREKKTGKK